MTASRLFRSSNAVGGTFLFYLTERNLRGPDRRGVPDERGEPRRLFDEKARRWLRIADRGIRRMDKNREGDPDVLRFQPYRDRAHDHGGRLYERRNAEP